MTDDSIETKALALSDRLRIIPDANGMMYDDYDDVMEAADLIEAQAAGIERLRAEAKAHYDRGYYDGGTYLLEQHEALREALEAAPLIGRTESVNDFMARQNAWLNGPYRAALGQSK
jgi:hypothetical protein